MAVLCENCAGRLIFNPASQKLECATCGSSFYPEDVEDKYADASSKYYDTRVYTCSHCGAEIITSDTEVSTFCVYCGNPSINFSRISKEYRPDGLIPFQVTKEDAIRYINIRLLKNPIVPKELKSKCVAENLRGIYVPYWIVNADYTEADFLTGKVQQGKRTETRCYSRAGNVSFKNVPVDGSRILNDDVSCKLEPFYLEDSKTFDEDYLNGFYSNTSDMRYNDLRNSAAHRCHKLFEEDVVKTVEAKDVKIKDYIHWIDIADDPVYMMLPVWFLTFKYNEKPYTILVNGQTGKVVGTMPWEKKRVVAIGVSVFLFVVALFALLWVSMYFEHGAFYFFTIFNAYGFAGLLVGASAAFTAGIVGIRRIWKNLRLTQSEDIFKYVKKRQG